MSENNNETKNHKKPLFNRSKENYKIFKGVIIQSEEGGFNEWRLGKNQTPKSLAEYLLSYGLFTEEIFYHDFSAALFQCEEDTDYLKHLKEMVAYYNPFEYRKILLNQLLFLTSFLRALCLSSPMITAPLHL